MIRIDPDVFTYQENADYCSEVFVVTGTDDTDAVYGALRRVRQRFQYVDNTGAELPDFDAIEEALSSGRYTPNYCSFPQITAPGEVEMYVDCKGEIPDPMADRLRAILREELEAANLAVHVKAAN